MQLGWQAFKMLNKFYSLQQFSCRNVILNKKDNPFCGMSDNGLPLFTYKLVKKNWEKYFYRV